VITALSGGVGASKFLAGLVRVVPASDVTAVVNTADDMVLHGLSISPDLDTVMYRLAGRDNPETGWGLAGESWTVMGALGALGGASWFALGDKDLATHLYRTQRLSEGAGLAQVTAELFAAHGVAIRALPMSEDAVRTRLTPAEPAEVAALVPELAGKELAFQEYFVRLHHAVAVTSLRYAGATDARPGPGVIEALHDAAALVVCPSNPLLSIGPIVAIREIAELLAARREDVVAVSPLVAGAAIKGPADHLMAELGHESSALGVARLYAPWAATMVIDEADAACARDIESVGMRCVVAPTVMHDVTAATHLARVVLDAGH
jgi:LPPG:FO 2-phospho-L-lactate transferase